MYRVRRLIAFLLFGCGLLWAGGAEAATLRLTWADTSNNESGFRIERLNGASYVQIATVGENVQSYTDSGLVNGSTYCYRVLAFNSAGSSAATNACATIPLASTPTTTPSLRLTWTDTSTNESGFRIERLNGASYVQIATVGENVQSYTDSGLVNGSTYCYRVLAFNSAGSSATTSNACATIPQASTPTTPTPPPSSPSSDPTTPQLASTWRDYRLSMKIRSDDNDAIGVMFRYQDNENYYRFSWFAEGNSRRLEKRLGGAFKILAQDQAVYKSGQTYTLEILAHGSSLKVLIDGKTVFSVNDSTFAEGTIALYSYYNAGSSFDDIIVQDLTTGTTLLSADFNDGTHVGWTFIDEGNDQGPSQWSARTGALVQSSNLGSALNNFLGTYALYTKRNWKDYRVALKMLSKDDDRLGLLFRYQDDANYYRFAWNKSGLRRQLVKKENGVFKILAEDAVPYTIGVTYTVEVIAQGSSIKVNIDGASVFAVSDSSFDSGTVAFYASYNQGSVFDDILVEQLPTKALLVWNDFNQGDLAGWTVLDENGTDNGPSNWSVINGKLVQSSNVGSDATGHPGTFLLY